MWTVTDDTDALQRVITMAAKRDQIVFFDFGVYKVTRTVNVPPESKIVGETYPVIMSSGEFFADINQPQPVVRIGRPGEAGSIEWSDMIVSTQGHQPGAVLFEVNLAASTSKPTGLWDVHARVGEFCGVIPECKSNKPSGGFAGSNLQVAQCPTTPTVATPPAPVNTNCIAAYLMMHVTRSATALYLENVWLWTADHDLDDPTR